MGREVPAGWIGFAATARKAVCRREGETAIGEVVGLVRLGATQFRTEKPRRRPKADFGR